MSLPLTRRIARTALLVVAGAAPVVGAAGSASAAALPAVSTLAGLSSVDATHVGGVVDSTAKRATKTANSSAGNTVRGAVPNVDTHLGKGGTSAPETAQQVAGSAAGTAGTASQLAPVA